MVDVAAFSPGDLFTILFTIQPHQKYVRLKSIEATVTESRRRLEDADVDDDPVQSAKNFVLYQDGDVESVISDLRMAYVSEGIIRDFKLITKRKLEACEAKVDFKESVTMIVLDIFNHICKHGGGHDFLLR
ncbi:hypothetical protein BC941DRAFT_504601 [Chlamydoabsidia padenii]|nr:hypothetical protein BC941DRAFT_504601 [Chlamydoabsidia padenii]